MAGFYMLAGTVLSDIDMAALLALLSAGGLACRMEEDELRIDGSARLYIRPGFAHEFILVGDAREEADLRQDCERLSLLLQEQGLPHAYELYDRGNDVIEEFDFTP